MGALEKWGRFLSAAAFAGGVLSLTRVVWEMVHCSDRLIHPHLRTFIPDLCLVFFSVCQLYFGHIVWSVNISVWLLDVLGKLGDGHDFNMHRMFVEKRLFVRITKNQWCWITGGRARVC